MSATRTTRRSGRRAARASKRVRPAAKRTRPAAKAARPAAMVKPVRKIRVIAPPEQTLYRLCKPGWAVVVDKVANAQGTRFVCPFCPLSHRVPGPVRGFQRMRRAKWVKLRRVEE